MKDAHHARVWFIGPSRSDRRRTDFDRDAAADAGYPSYARGEYRWTPRRNPNAVTTMMKDAE